MELIFNGVSSKDLNFQVVSYRKDTLALKRFQEAELPQFDGVVYEESDTFEPYNLDIECIMKRTFADENIKGIKNLFKQFAGELVLSDKPNNILKVRLISSIEFEEMIKYTGSFLLSFKVQPFSYLASGREWITVNNNFKIINQGNYSCKPLYKITGSGSCSLTINNKVMNFSKVNKSFIVDTELEDCYGAENNNDNLNNFMNIESDFIGFEEGENIIKLTGISKLEVLPNWREL